MKQICLEFLTENNVLPIEMEKILVSFLKKTISEYSLEFFERLFSKDKSILKTYTFSKYLKDARFENGKIILSDSRFLVFFSDSNLVQLIEFYNAFLGQKNKKFSLNQNSMILKKVSFVNRVEILENKILVKMASPLIVRRHNSETNKDRYFCYDEEEFQDVVIENLRFFLEKIDKKFDINNFEIIPIKCKKVIVTSFGMKIQGNIGIFKLTGSKELLNLLYLSGIGVRRSAGNGKFEIIG